MPFDAFVRVRCCASSAALRRAASSVALIELLALHVLFLFRCFNNFNWCFNHRLLLIYASPTTALLLLVCRFLAFGCSALLLKFAAAFAAPLVCFSFGSTIFWNVHVCAFCCSFSACFCQSFRFNCSGSGLVNVFSCELHINRFVLPEVLARL